MWNTNQVDYSTSNRTVQPNLQVNGSHYSDLTTTSMLTKPSKPSLSEYLLNDKAQSMRNNKAAHENNSRSIGHGFTIDEIMRR